MSDVNDLSPVEKSVVSNARNGGTQLLDKALNMVELVANTSQRLTAQDIATQTGYPRPTTYRILAALVRRGMLTLDERDQCYELGLRFADLMTSLRASHRFLTFIERDLMLLSMRTGETVTVGIAERDSVRIISRYRIGSEVESGASRGSKRPFHASGIGKAALAWLPESELPQYLKRIQFQPLTANTLQTPEALSAELSMIRARGYAIDDEEIIENVRCVARPLLSREGHLIGTISLSAPAFRMTPLRIRQLAGALGRIADLFTLRFGTEYHCSQHTGSFLTSLHEGGLYRPIAIGESGEDILVVDAMAPAIHRFTADGVLTDTYTAPVIPHAAAIDTVGRVVIAASNGQLHDWQSGTWRTIEPVMTDIVDLAFDGHCLLAAVAGPHPQIKAVENGSQPVALDSVPIALACHEGKAAVIESINGAVSIYCLQKGKCIDRLHSTQREDPPARLAFSEHVLYLVNDASDYLKRVDLDSLETDYLTLPGRYMTAMTCIKAQLYMASASFEVPTDEDGAIPGSLYRTSSS